MPKPYVKPAATKLTLEQVKLKLLGRTLDGDQAAMQFLELMFPEPRVTQEKARKKSA